ncbi:hypothetical protein HG530_014006 [Fusarium avenaceum]|nr:hypothetical protein HG530_014006 [Fusarium avenaceum]
MVLLLRFGKNLILKLSCSFFDLLVESLIRVTATNAGTTLKRVGDQHAMISEESAALHHIVTAARDKRGAYNTHNLSEQVIMLFKSTWIGAVDL